MYFTLVATLLLFSQASAQQYILYDDVPDRLYEGIHFTMPRVPLPQIPQREVTISEFGAVADGVTLNTAAINAAITACAQKGGGRVIIPPGVWRTGPINLQSNIDLHLQQGALVIFSSNIDDFPMVQRPKSSSFSRSPLIYGVGLKNVALTGKGVFNGNGQYWRPVKKEKLPASHWKKLIESGGALTSDGKLWFPSKEAVNAPQQLEEARKEKKKLDSSDYAAAREFMRPDFLVLLDCETILIDGPTFVNSPKFTVHPIQSADIVIRNMAINNEWWAQNGDAIDLSSCRNVVVYNNVINAGDDGICVKPGAPRKSTKDLPACENYIIADCIVYHAHGGFVVGSESYGGARNISVRNLTCIWTDIGLRFKSARGRGGVVENIVIDGVRMKDIANEAILFDMSYGGDPTIDVSDKSRVPHFRNISIKNVVCDGATAGLRMSGLDDQPIQTLSLDHATLIADEALILENVQDIQLRNIAVQMKKGPVLTVRKSQNVLAEDITSPAGTDIFVSVDGKEVKDVRIRKADADHARKAVDLKNNADATSVIILNSK